MNLKFDIVLIFTTHITIFDYKRSQMISNPGYFIYPQPFSFQCLSITLDHTILMVLYGFTFPSNQMLSGKAVKYLTKIAN